MKFKELGFNKTILKNVELLGYNDTTEIQSLAIPHILKNEDVIGIAQTGTGKTAAYSLPIVEKIMNEECNRKVKALILSPTRELAIQIRDNIREFTKDTNYRSAVVLGGVNQRSQIEILKKGVDILVATPGRLLDLNKRHLVNLNNVKVLVLDEADTMLDMGFINDVKDIIKRTPIERQTLLFSATIPSSVKKLAEEFMKEPITVRAAREQLVVPKIKQLLYFVEKKNKFNLLLDLLVDEKIKNSIIFTRTKNGANELAEKLREYDIKCSVIHGNKTQKDRVKALDNFKTGKTNILVATDIAARGIDISGLSHVINYDMPEHEELYVHRIGRTARAGLEGTSIAMCDVNERKKLVAIEKLIGEKLIVIDDHKYAIKFIQEKEKKLEKRKETKKYYHKGRYNKRDRKANDGKKYSNFSNKNTKKRKNR